MYRYRKFAKFPLFEKVNIDLKAAASQMGGEAGGGKPVLKVPSKIL